MSVKVRIPSPLRSYTNGVDVVEVPGNNVGEVLNGLKDKASGIETRLFKGPNQLNRFVNVYVNDEDIRFLKNLETPVKAGDEVSIVPAIAGGTTTTANKVIVRLPSMMRQYCEGLSIVELEPGTVDEILSRLSEKCPSLGSRLLLAPGRLNRNLNLFINDEEFRYLGGFSAVVKPGDEISVVSGVAGGT